MVINTESVGRIFDFTSAYTKLGRASWWWGSVHGSEETWYGDVEPYFLMVFFEGGQNRLL